MFTIIVSVIIIAIAIIAIISEAVKAEYEHCYVPIFPIGFAIVSAVGTSAFSICVEKGYIHFEAWQSIGIVCIVAVIAVAWTIFEFKGDISFTIYPWISTMISLIVFAAASIVAWVM